MLGDDFSVTNAFIVIVALVVIARLLPTVRRPDASHNFDYLGGAVFTVAVSAFLIGLTNKQTDDWGTFAVGGLILIGLALWGVFVLIESRAKEPIVPLGLWRDRTYASSIIATFLVSIGFFGRSGSSSSRAPRPPTRGCTRWRSWRA